MRVSASSQRIQNAFRRGPLFGALLLIASVAWAHDTWVRPEKAQCAPGEAMLLRATSGMEFPKLDASIAPDRIARAEYRLGGVSAPISEQEKGKKSLNLTIRPGRAGTVVAWLESKPRWIDLKPAEVEEYLGEIGAEEVAREWKASGNSRWHETYTKHAKTYFRVGEGSEERSWAQPVGMALEIVSETDPTRLRAGDELSVRVLKEGKPLSGLPLVAVAAGQKHGTLAKTDSEGRARFRLDRKGWWLLKGTELVRAAGADSDWESHFTTLTAFVGER